MAQRSGAQAGPVSGAGSATAVLLDQVLTGRLLLLAPHMDDETLACGGMILMHEDPAAVHCLFATDGAASPAPLLPWLGPTDPGLGARRRQEARNAAAQLGLPGDNLEFLDFPDGSLAAHRARLESALGEAIARLQPDFVLAPFRHDVHPDHVALNRAARHVLRQMERSPGLLEYFVYHRLRGLPGGDVRGAVRPDAMLVVNIRRVAAAKRAALDCYLSQTRLQHDWQERPILTEESLGRRCSEPECFLPADPAGPLDESFAAYAYRVRLAAWAMRVGKRPKDQARALLRWALRR
jgi:LmbE family N-acetylglucosaminyl deacetylase